MLKQLLALEKLYLLALRVRLVLLVLLQLAHLAHLAHLARKARKAQAVFLEVRALQVMLEVLVLLPQIWFTATQIHRSQTQTQETIITTDTLLTIQTGTVIKCVAQTTMQGSITTLVHITLLCIFLQVRVFLNITPLHLIMEALIALRLIIQTLTVTTVVIIIRLIMMDLTAVFIIGMDIGGMPIIR